MSDERRWKIVRRRDWFNDLGHIHPFDEAPHADAELEVIEVMPVAEHEAALARVERERDEARRDLNGFRDGLTAALNAMGVPAMPSWPAAMEWIAERLAERDALRAQVKALTDKSAVEAAADAVTALWKDPDPIIREMALDEVRVALAAARDAAAAKAPDS
jgi:hypothetical protein